jgi:hypothetical protein
MYGSEMWTLNANSLKWIEAFECFVGDICSESHG